MHSIAWQPQIGDPTFAGWFTVFSYFLSAYLSFKAWRSLRAGAGSHHKEKSFWFALGLLCLLLGINKQLDLQSLLTAVGKYLAHKQGWYQSRRVVQEAFIVMVLILGAGFIAWGLRFFKGILNRNWLAFTGTVFLVVFILIRATSFHHMDQLIGLRILGFKMNWLLELSGIYCIALNAKRIMKRRKR